MFRLSLRVAFAIVTILAMLCAWIGASVRQGVVRAQLVKRLDSLESQRAPGYWTTTHDNEKWHTFLAFLAGGKYEPPLSSVGFARTGFQESDLAILREFPETRSVVLNGVALSDSGVEHLFRLKHLQEVNLADTDVTDSGVTQLAHTCRSVRLLDVYGCNVGGRSLAAVLRLPEIQRAVFSYTNVGDGYNDASASSIEELYLNHSDADDGVVRCLANCHKLQILELSGTEITDMSVPILSGLRSLERLTVQETRVTSKGVSALKEALPECQVVAD